MEREFWGIQSLPNILAKGLTMKLNTWSVEAKRNHSDHIYILLIQGHDLLAKTIGTDVIWNSEFYVLGLC